MQVSKKMRIVAAAGAGLVLLVLVAKMTVLKGGGPLPPIVIPAAHHPVVGGSTHKAAGPRVPQVDPSLPMPLRRALLRHGIVVAVLYAPDAAGDGASLDAAQAGARDAHAGFAVLNVRSEGVATALAAKLPGASDPSVLVVRRPGTFEAVIPGFADREIVAQAVRNAT